MIPVFSLWVALSLGACPDPYCRTRADTGIPNDPNAHCLWWGGSTLTYNINDQGNPANGADSFTAIESAWATWQAVSNECGNFTVQEGPHIPDRQIGYDERSTNNTNLLVFRTQYCLDFVSSTDPCWSNRSCQNTYYCWANGASTIALTTTTYDVRTGQIYDADIEFNAAKFNFTTFVGAPCPPGQTQGCTATDIQNTATHEIGHYLGLDHTTFLPPRDSTGSYPYRPVMEATAPLGDLGKRTIDPGSHDFICQAYPKGARARDCNGASVGSLVNQVQATATSTGCAISPGQARGSAGPSAALPWLALLAFAVRARRR